MNKKLLSLAVAAAFAAPVAMASEMTVYGVAHVALTTYDGVGTAVAGTPAGDYWDLASAQSRLGVKGSEDLGDDLKAIYKMEFAVQMTDDAADDAAADLGTINDGDLDSNMAMRNAYVGLAGDWGTFLMGRHDTPLKISTRALDIFGDTIADNRANSTDGEEAHTRTTLGFTDVRADNAIAYITPNMNGFTLAGAIVTPGFETVGGGSGLDTDLAEAYSVAAMYSNGPFYASLAYEDYSDAIVSAAANDGFSLTRVGLGYTANNLHVGFVYEDNNNDTNTADAEIWQLSASYTFGNNVVKAAYGEHDNNTNANDRTVWAVGVDHNFSKKTQAYVVYNDTDMDLAGANDWSGLSLGLKTSF